MKQPSQSEAAKEKGTDTNAEMAASVPATLATGLSDLEMLNDDL
jgi:hypothetical protein